MALNKQEKKELDEYYIKISKLTKSELHSKSIEFANSFLERYPDTWSSELKKSRYYKAIVETLKSKK